MASARIGCSGWNYRHWSRLFYPADVSPAHWLEYYAQEFDTVEVNATFYRLPSRRAVEAWARATPPGFLFAIKVSRYLTHVKRLRDVGDGAKRLLDPLEPLAEAGKLGPLLWQLPETFRRDDAHLADALEQLPPGRHCFEFRHASWFAPEVERLLAARDVALVIADHPRRRFQSLALTASWTYVRFHQGRARDDAYGPAALRTWARRIRGWGARGDAYAYFNDDWAGHAVAEARELRALLGRPDDRTDAASLL